jgi:NAD(P)H-nitrite reductase large subunit
MKHVIIGASAAGLNAAQKIRDLCPTDEIVVISSEDKVYSRCMLHHLIGGQRTVDGMRFVSPDLFAKNHIQWQKGKTVKSLDTTKKQIYLASGEVIDYDQLLIATGALASLPPIPNLRTANNVFTLRVLADAIAVTNQARAGETAIVIGGGLIGIDTAAGLAEKGVRVSIIEMADRILPVQLDKTSAAKYESLFKQQGINIFTGKSVQEVLINENKDVLGVKLSDGQIFSASLIVVAAGVRPNTDWINDPAISVGKGIITDDQCKTTADAVYAAGDVAGKTGIWPLAVKQGITAAYNMCGQEKVLVDNFNQKNSMNFFGLQTISLGLAEAPDDSYEVDVYDSPAAYKKIIHKDGIVYGAIFQGDIAHRGVWTSIIGNGLSIAQIKDKCIFDIDYGDFFKTSPDGQFYY